MEPNLPTREQLSAVARKLRSKGREMRLRLVSARKGDAPAAEVSRTAPASKVVKDDLDRLVEMGDLLAPPYEPDDLVFITERSTAIGQCVDAMVTNIDRQGRQFKTSRNVEPMVEDGTISEDEIQRQRTIVEDWFSNCNPKMSFEEVKARRTRDLYTIGWSGIEVRRDTTTNEPVALNHVPGHLLRASRESLEPVLMRLWIRDPSTRKWTDKLFNEYVRTYATKRAGRVVWFKEFGDTRSISSVSGQPTGRDKPDYSKPDEAHELLWFSLHASGREPYGVPPWISNTFGVAGTRYADILNLTSLMDGRIPRVCLITDMEFDYDVEEYLEEKLTEAAEPSRRFSPFVIQGLPKETSVEEAMAGIRTQNQARWEWVKLSDVIPDDAMYTNYDEAISKRIQRNYRLPDILVGRSAELNRATAYAAIDMAERQVFGPPRREDDWVFNRRLIPEIDDTWTQEMTSLGPQIVDADDVAKIVTAMAQVGVGSPNAWAKLAERVTGVPFDPRSDVAGQLPLRLLELLIGKDLIEVVEDPEDETRARVQIVGPAARVKDGTATDQEKVDVATRFAEARDEMVRLVAALRTGEAI